MGIAANQARLLALTARRCDLETQMQIILNNKLNIAKETSKIADDYNKSISNRRLFIFQPTIDVQTSIYQDLSANNLYNAGGLMLAQKNGANSYSQITINDSGLIEKGLREGTMFLVKEADLKTQDPKSIAFNNNYGGTPNGILTGIPQDSSGNDITKWEIIDWRTSTTIMDELDKTDDESALQNYERLMKALDVKGTTLDVEMNTIQTSHSAITNELESVKKIITKNTEDSFKYFT
jgi:hypothetical protein